MRVPFDTIWKVTNGTLTNKVNIRVSGITAYAGALQNYEGVFGGINWNSFLGRDIDVKIDGDEFIIMGIY